MPKCIVCGRFFHEGQGIIIKIPGGLLEFHSSRCAQRFLRMLLEERGSECVAREALELARGLRSSLERLEEGRAKAI
ncbi:hypothetical protein APE_0601a [Aeropyrum pernix K1]|uniref:TRASH domain-containing protein n=1 Tax=Aeropyrum pernix (strain ATCC 700893 / DSM 11879 / JCM 9820 / NBRC 100138 / K1) TaxID=272557 RepID=Q05E62_AERPE|nr:hypothetical protein [Aeropyrum pernix]BAF34739.1 hypothetical protein APE_0601a [Aeropyrum pernix K1]